MGVTEAVPITPWEKYLQACAITVISVVLIIISTKVIPNLINKLIEQSKAFAASNEKIADKYAEGQKVMAEALSRMTLNCTIAQNKLNNPNE